MRLDTEVKIEQTAFLDDIEKRVSEIFSAQKNEVEQSLVAKNNREKGEAQKQIDAVNREFIQVRSLLDQHKAAMDDLYLGQVDGSGTRFYRAHASQPDFSQDGARIAFHSWAGDSRGLGTMDVTGANANLISNFVEDQLPTWTVDGAEVVLLSRRSGGRQSQLIKVDGATEL